MAGDMLNFNLGAEFVHRKLTQQGGGVWRPHVQEVAPLPEDNEEITEVFPLRR